MADDLHVAERVEDPAESPGLPEHGVVDQVDLRLLRRGDDLGREQPGAVGSDTAVEVQLHEPEHVSGAGDDGCAHRAARAVEAPLRAHHQRLGVLRVRHVADRVRVADDLLGEGDGALQAERLEEPLAQGGLEDRATDDLDESAEDREAAVAVAPDRAGRSDLRQVADLVHVARQRVVAAAGVDEDVTVEAAGVAQQVADRDGVAGVRVADLEVGEVVAHRAVEVDQALVGEHQHQGRGVDLADRARQEERVGRHRAAGADAEHARRDLGDRVAVEHSELRSWDVVLVDELRQLLLELGLGVRHGSSSAYLQCR